MKPYRNVARKKATRAWQGFSALSCASALFLGIAVFAAAQPAAAGTHSPAPAARLVIGAALQRQLISLYAGYRHIPVTDIAGIAPGSIRSRRMPGSGADWASIGVLPSSRAPRSAMTGFQDGARYGIFNRPPGGAWRIAGLGGEPFGCNTGLPAAVRRGWHLAPCPSAGKMVAPKFSGLLMSGTTAGLAKIAMAQVGVSDNPPVTNFNGLDCNPYTALVGVGAPAGGCGRTSHSPWFSNVQDESEFWCADFTKWVWEKAGVSGTGTLTPAAASFYTWGVQHGEHISFGGTPQVGDAIILYPNGTSAPNGSYADHVGIVTAVNSNGTVDLVNGDFLGASNISVQYAADAKLSSWASQVESPGEKWAFVSPRLKSPPPQPAAGVPSGPAVYNPLSGTLEVYGTGQDSELEEYFWAPRQGWQRLELSGAPSGVAGRPSAVYDPLGNNLEVYARGTDGALEEYYYAPGKGWRSQQLPAPGPGTLTGSPSAVYDPVGKNLEVYATASDGNLAEFYWSPSRGWRSQELSGAPSALTGSPSAAYDPLSKVLEVYGTGQDGKLEEYFWTPANGWRTTEQALPGTATLTGSPSAVYDPAGQEPGGVRHRVGRQPGGVLLRPREGMAQPGAVGGAERADRLPVGGL